MEIFFQSIMKGVHFIEEQIEKLKNIIRKKYSAILCCGRKLIIVNKTTTPYDHIADIVIHDDLGKILNYVKGKKRLSQISLLSRLVKKRIKESFFLLKIIL